MKLEINTTPQNTFNQYNFSVGMLAEDAAKLLNAGVQFAKDGNRAEARALLLRVTESEPQNESAWLWLASISEYPEELIIFLQRVLEVNPQNERALEWLAATKSLFAKTFLQHGVKALQEDRREFARQCFLQARLNDPQNEDVWLELGSMAESSEEKTEYFERVLSINPANEKALSEMHLIKLKKARLILKEAKAAAVSGQRETAQEMLAQVFENAPDLEDAWLLKAFLAVEFNEKISCYEKVLQSNPSNEAARAGLASLKSLMQENAEPFEKSEELKSLSGEDFSQSVSEAQDVHGEEKDEAAAQTETPEQSAVYAENAEQFSEENSAGNHFENQMHESNDEIENETDSSIDFANADGQKNEETATVENSMHQNVSDAEHQENAGGKYTIMIIDDSPTIRRLVSAKLEKSGHAVLEAAGGPDALTKINNAKPDLILLDISMPEMDGYQVCEMIRENDAMKNIPVLLISGKDEFFDKARGDRAGSTGFISKPFGPETLMKTVETYLN